MTLPERQHVARPLPEENARHGRQLGLPQQVTPYVAAPMQPDSARFTAAAHVWIPVLEMPRHSMTTTAISARQDWPPRR
jgi:hypothetical protein